MSKSVKVLNCRIDRYTFSGTLSIIKKFLLSKKSHYAVTPNPEILLLANRDIKLKKIINNSDLSTADGAGLLWAAKYLQIPTTKIPVINFFQALWQMIYSMIFFAFKPSYANIIPERVTGTDLVPEIAKICAENNKSIFFLGAAPGVAKKAAIRLKAINPKLKIAGTSANDWPQEFDDTNCQLITKSKADCLLLAFGAPRDQYWIKRNLPKLKNIKFVIGVGGAFDFIAEETSIFGGKKAVRAPKWIRMIHLEWLHRLYFQPNRVWRIFNAVFIFPWLVYLEKIKK